MDIEWKPKKRRKMDKRAVNKLIDYTINNSYASKERVIVNTENIRLLLADPDFQAWAREVRKRAGIPPDGFKSQSAKVKKWLAARDDELWFEQVSEVFIRYTKINEQYRTYIDKYIVFNNDFHDLAIKPFETFSVGRYEIMFRKLSDFLGRRSKKIPQLVINVYAPPIGKEWDKIISEVNEYFERFDIPIGKNAFRPTKNFDLKLISLKSKEAIDKPFGDDYPEVETDKVLIERQYPKAKPDEIKRMVRNLPRERKNAKALLVTRLGKTEVNLPSTRT